MQPQNYDFNSYINILYYQSNTYFYATPNSASFLDISDQIELNGGLGTAKRRNSRA